MELECVVSLCAALFQLAGLICFVGSKVLPSERTARSAEYLLISCLVALGTITLVSALMKTGCAVSTGLTIFLLALAIIHHPSRGIPVDPYTLIYPSEAQASR